jgi:hypothetical protein
MKCTDVRAALPLLIYGEPSPEDVALREHLSICVDCRREHEALLEVRRLLDDSAVPRVAVNWPQFHRSLVERQLHRERRWRRIAVALGTLAAAMLLTIGLRMEVRLEASQFVVRWGNSPSRGSDAPLLVDVDPHPSGLAVPLESTEAELHVLSDLIHALKVDADERDQRFVERLEQLEKHVRVLQSQSDLRWNATEENVAALYLLSRKGEKP